MGRKRREQRSSRQKSILRGASCWFLITTNPHPFVIHWLPPYQLLPHSHNSLPLLVVTSSSSNGTHIQKFLLQRMIGVIGSEGSLYSSSITKKRLPITGEKASVKIGVNHEQSRTLSMNDSIATQTRPATTRQTSMASCPLLRPGK